MSNKQSVEFPVFLIATGNKGFALAERKRAQDGNETSGIVLCTMTEIAERFIASSGLKASLWPVASAEELGELLRGLPLAISCIAFDPEPGPQGLRPRGWHEIAQYLDAFPPTFVWDYPLYVPKTANGNYLTAQANAPGRAETSAVMVFTDEDLAERFASAQDIRAEIQPVPNVAAFDRLVREQNIQTVCFDPANMTGGELVSRAAYQLDKLLNRLAREMGTPASTAPKPTERPPSNICRYGAGKRWSEVVVHNGTAYWVEVAETPSLDARGQIAQVLGQINTTLTMIGAERTDLVQVLIYLADLADAPVLNEVWDAWVPTGHAPVRACVQAGLAPGYKVEMVVTAAAPGSDR